MIFSGGVEPLPQFVIISNCGEKINLNLIHSPRTQDMECMDEGARPFEHQEEIVQ
jgi:hypothetical protein